MSIETKELKPCPFCGGSDIEIMHDTSSDYEKHLYWNVGCISCDAEFSVCSTEQQCIEKWNTRDNTHFKQEAKLILSTIQAKSYDKSRGWLIGKMEAMGTIGEM